jgi:hypothetical protein
MTKITKMLARLVISIGLLGACAFCRRYRTQNGPLCRAWYSPRTPMEAAPQCQSRRFL